MCTSCGTLKGLSGRLALSIRSAAASAHGPLDARHPMAAQASCPCTSALAPHSSAISRQAVSAVHTASRSAAPTSSGNGLPLGCS